MLNLSPSRLTRESGLSKIEAQRVWNEFALSGFGSWQPWLWLVIWMSVYIWLRFWEVLAPLGRLGEILTGTVFLVAVIGMVAIAFSSSYPHALAEARRRAKVKATLDT